MASGNKKLGLSSAVEWGLMGLEWREGPASCFMMFHADLTKAILVLIRTEYV